MTGCSWLSQDKDLSSRSVVRSFLSHHEYSSLLRSKGFESQIFARRKQVPKKSLSSFISHAA